MVPVDVTILLKSASGRRDVCVQVGTCVCGRGGLGCVQRGCLPPSGLKVQLGLSV